jgi:hypothetical protein
MELTDGVVESYTELNELQASSMEKLTESFEAWREELEKSAASVESIGEVIGNF